MRLPDVPYVYNKSTYKSIITSNILDMYNKICKYIGIYKFVLPAKDGVASR